MCPRNGPATAGRPPLAPEMRWFPLSSRQSLLPANIVYRQVAIDYWNTVARLGQEAAAWGRKALHHLQHNNLNAAKNAVYYARYLERPIAQHSLTWESIPALSG